MTVNNWLKCIKCYVGDVENARLTIFLFLGKRRKHNCNIVTDNKRFHKVQHTKNSKDILLWLLTTILEKANIPMTAILLMVYVCSAQQNTPTLGKVRKAKLLFKYTCFKTKLNYQHLIEKRVLFIHSWKAGVYNILFLSI